LFLVFHVLTLPLHQVVWDRCSVMKPFIGRLIPIIVRRTNVSIVKLVDNAFIWLPVIGEIDLTLLDLALIWLYWYLVLPLINSLIYILSLML
jgi:hypothetical protein